jgi:hypothetical protein
VASVVQRNVGTTAVVDLHQTEPVTHTSGKPSSARHARRERARYHQVHRKRPAGVPGDSTAERSAERRFPAQDARSAAPSRSNAVSRFASAERLALSSMPFI